ncbi:charged multivesicular body protein 4c-like isoform X1 [Lates japonicus]|uniref:Charged multivesicular body protein 4c-like isoform X1 n=1 Tax=Lates japonicus TaxID=270547 RepID=A0AAD3N9A7_LATJO|nr:charged multivesicular body protein 4c-like isoform X1 [Lates japonicus]
MGVGASQKEDSVIESPPSSQSSTESSESSDSSSRLPAILITAPSREDIHASPSTITIADANKERRPSSTPFVVGKKLAGQQ